MRNPFIVLGKRITGVPTDVLITGLGGYATLLQAYQWYASDDRTDHLLGILLTVGGVFLFLVAWGQYKSRHEDISVTIPTVLSSTHNNHWSIIRITNATNRKGTATVKIFNDATGASLGVYTADPISPRGHVQFGARKFEDAVGITPAKGVNYRLFVEANVEGHVDHFISTQGSAATSGTVVKVSKYD